MTVSEQIDNMESDNSELPPRDLRIVSLYDVRASGWARFAQDPDDIYLPSIPSDCPDRHGGYVSIWIGVLSAKQILDSYIEQPIDSFDIEEGEEGFCPLWDDLGFSVPHEAIKAIFNESSVSIIDLLRTIPKLTNTNEPILASCRTLGIDRGNAILAIFDLDYSRPQNLCFGRLQFVGSFINNY